MLGVGGMKKKKKKVDWNKRFGVKYYM